MVSGAQYEEIVQAVHARAAAAARTLPNPGGLTSAALREAAEADATLREVLSMCRPFQFLLRGRVANVAYVRHQLRGE